MAQPRTPTTSPARHCDDIIELIDLVLATCASSPIDGLRPELVLATAPSG